MMKNTLRQLYQERSNREREKRDCYKKAFAILHGNHIKQFHDLLNSENSYSRYRTLQHFAERLEWIRRSANARKPPLPDSIDNIHMKDVTLSPEFESKPRVYGGCTLSESEMKTLSLPPKFAVFKKIDSFDCKSEVEKAFTKLRWK